MLQLGYHITAMSFRLTINDILTLLRYELNHFIIFSPLDNFSEFVVFFASQKANFWCGKNLPFVRSA